MLFAPLSMPNREQVTVSVEVVLFAVGLSLAAALVFGLVPAWHVTRTDLTWSLKSDPAFISLREDILALIQSAPNVAELLPTAA